MLLFDGLLLLSLSLFFFAEMVESGKLAMWGGPTVNIPIRYGSVEKSFDKFVSMYASGRGILNLKL